MGGYDDCFATSNSQRITWPANEWAITAQDEHARANSSNSRKLQKIEDLVQCDLARKAKLTKCEVIAVVLYTGPMVSWMQIRMYCFL